MFYLRAYFLILVTAAMLSACGGGDIQNSAATDTSQSGFEPKLPVPRAAAEITPVSTSSALASQAVNLQDAIAILKMIVGLEVNSSGQSVTAYQAYAADIDGNGKVELTDALKAGAIADMLLVMRQGGRLAANRGERGAKIHGGCGFTNATFLVEQRDHAHFFLAVHRMRV